MSFDLGPTCVHRRSSARPASTDLDSSLPAGGWLADWAASREAVCHESRLPGWPHGRMRLDRRCRSSERSQSGCSYCYLGGGMLVCLAPRQERLSGWLTPKWRASASRAANAFDVVVLSRLVSEKSSPMVNPAASAARTVLSNFAFAACRSLAARRAVAAAAVNPSAAATTFRRSVPTRSAAASAASPSHSVPAGRDDVSRQTVEGVDPPMWRYRTRSCAALNQIVAGECPHLRKGRQRRRRHRSDLVDQVFVASPRCRRRRSPHSTPLPRSTAAGA